MSHLLPDLTSGEEGLGNETGKNRKETLTECPVAQSSLKIPARN